MRIIRRIITTQPILFSRVIASVAALAIAFGAPISDADVASAVEATTMLLAAANVVLAMLDREAVYSPNTHEQEVAEAYQAGMKMGSEFTAEEFRANRMV